MCVSCVCDYVNVCGCLRGVGMCVCVWVLKRCRSVCMCVGAHGSVCAPLSTCAHTHMHEHTHVHVHTHKIFLLLSVSNPKPIKTVSGTRLIEAPHANVWCPGFVSGMEGEGR